MSSSCGTLSSSHLVKNSHGSLNYSCLPSGKYSLQVIGRSNLQFVEQNAKSEFGRNYELSIIAKNILLSNHFDLSDTSRAENWKNNAALIYGEIGQSMADTFGCNSTLRPFSVEAATHSKSIFRVFNIGDQDSDAIPDSGQLLLTGLNPNLRYEVFQGDAQSLARAQGKTSFPDQINGLSPVDHIANTTDWGKCLMGGKYTLVALSLIHI